MKFNRYQHVERFGMPEVENIELGVCYIFPKIDGTNSSVWLNDEGELRAGSRNRELTLEKDNAGFYAYISENSNIISYLKKHPTHRIYGEWLVPHSLRTYRDSAWRKLYVFDVCVDNAEKNGGNEYLPYEVYKPLLDEFNIEYIPPLRIVTNPTLDYLNHLLDENDYLIKDGAGAGEGIVIKNYDFYNEYGRQTWAKIVRSEFREIHHKAMGAPESECKIIEQDIVDKFVTSAFVEKEYEKIANEAAWTSKMIPRLLGTVYHELISEEMWNILKQFKSPKIDFKVLNALTIRKIKAEKPEIFG